MDIMGAQRNLHTLLIPFSGDVRAKEYAFKKNHTHALKNAGAHQLCPSSRLS